ICSVILSCVLLAAIVAADSNLDYSNLMEKGRAEYRSGQFAAAAVSLNSALRALARSDYPERAKTLVALGDAYICIDELSKADRVYRESLALYEKLDDKKQTALVLRDLGAVYSLQRRDDDALRVLQRALKLTKTSHEASLEVEVLNVTG